MKQLNSYIIEKLHLNKDIEIGDSFSEPSEVCKALNFTSFEHKDTIRRWMEDNKINNVLIYAEVPNKISDDELSDYNFERIKKDEKLVNDFIRKSSENADQLVINFRSKEITIYHNRTIDNCLMINDKRLSKVDNDLKTLFFLLKAS